MSAKYTSLFRSSLGVVALGASLLLSGALASGCAPAQPAEDEPPHYGFQPSLLCATCPDQTLGRPGDTVTVTLLRNGSEPGEDIICFEQSFAFERRETVRQLEFRFPNRQLGTAREAWVEATVTDADGEVRAVGKQRLTERAEMPNINAFEFELAPPTNEAHDPWREVDALLEAEDAAE